VFDPFPRAHFPSRSQPTKLAPPRPPDVTGEQKCPASLQVLYDGAILSGVQLQGALIGTDEALKVRLAPITLEERARVWYAIQTPYRLSVTYEARVVNLDSEDEEHIAPVAQRKLKYFGPEASL
jgi:hypothetical protein